MLNPLIDQESPPPGRPRGKRPLTLQEYLSYTRVIQNQMHPRLLGSTTMKARRQSHHSAAPNGSRTAGTEIIDRERERKWLEQMDTILIFVCFACF